MLEALTAQDLDDWQRYELKLADKDKYEEIYGDEDAEESGELTAKQMAAMLDRFNEGKIINARSV